MGIKFRFVAITAAMVLLSTTLVMAKEITLKFVTAAPKGTPWVLHAEKSAENISTATNGEIKVDIFPASQLGVETETIKQVARGRIDLGNFSIAAAATVVPEIMLLVSPFFWDSPEQADCAIDNHLTDVFSPIFEKYGLKILQWQELGWQILFSKEKITSPDQVKGVKLRVPTVINETILWKELGANGVPLAFADTHAAIQTGVVDGGILPTISYIATGLNKVAPNMTLTYHVYQPTVNLVSLKTWKKLSAEQQKILKNSWESSEKIRTSVRAAVKAFEKKHLESGGVIHDLTTEERQQWKDKYTKEMQDQLIKEIGGNASQIFEKVVQARNACRK